MTKPNILWIVLDHVTFRHYKMTKGAKPVLNTYERLAAEGMEFTNAHSVHPLCLPARASMMTGMYSNNHKKVSNGRHEDAGYPLFSSFMIKEGYSLGYFGKNHSGYEDLKNYGFEGFYPPSYGNPYTSPEYKEYLRRNGLQNPIYCQEWGIETDKQKWENGDYDLTISENFNTYTSGYIKTPGPVHEVDFILSMAMDWLDTKANEDNEKPFAMRVDMWGPHHAFQVPLEYKELINPEEVEEYPSFGRDIERKPQFSRDFLNRIKSSNPRKTWKEWQPIMKRAYENYSYIDAKLGKLLDKLEQNGKADNTIIIYTADHGDSLGSHGGMVDKAGDMMEEVMSIPMVIKWPGITDGTKSHALVSNLDIVPTVLELAGIKPPEYMDGKSMAPLMKGDSDNWREDFMAQHYGHFKVYAPQRTLYYKNYKYIATLKDIHELYDLDTDPFELNNLINNNSYMHILHELQRRLLANMEMYSDIGGDTAELRDEIRKKLYTAYVP